MSLLKSSLSTTSFFSTSQVEKAWHRQLRYQSLVFCGYLLVFIVGYFLLQRKVSEPDVFFYLQKRLALLFVAVFFLHIVLFVVLKRALIYKVVSNFFSEKVSPYNLAFFRGVFFFWLTGHTFFAVPQKFFPRVEMAAGNRVSLPYMSWFIENVPISIELYSTLTYILAALFFMAALGILTRPVLIISIPIAFYVFGVPFFFGKLNHDHINLWIPVLMAFAPCDEVLSVDALIRKFKGKHVQRRPHRRYGLAFKQLLVLLGGIYFFSGIWKLLDAGFFWALSDNPVNLLRLEWFENFDAVPWIRIDRFPVLCSFGALLAILIELAYPFMILTRGGRFWAMIELLVFHKMNHYFLNIGFQPLQKLQMVNVDWVNIYQRVKRVSIKGKFLAVIVGLILLFLLDKAFSGSNSIIVIGSMLLLSGFVISRIPKKRKTKEVRPEKDDSRYGLPVKFWLRIQQGVGWGLVGINLLCGAFAIHSWPFSSYPSYSFVRKSYIEYAEFVPMNTAGKVINIDQLLEEKGIRKEGILPMGEKALRSYYAGKRMDFEVDVLNYWARLRAELPQLEDANNVNVLIIRYDLNPDLDDKVLRKTTIGSVGKEMQGWELTDVSINEPDDRDTN